jgi:mannitol 2-dehydrogenase
MTSTTLPRLERPAHLRRDAGRTPEGPRRPTEGLVPLAERNVPLLRGRVALPGYDRASLSTGVVHLGVGNFHRAHQAVYFDQLAQQGITGWGILGIGVRSRRVCELLSRQDLLFTVAELSATAPRFRVVGALHHYLYAPDQPAQALSALAAPGTALVTLTLTGDGYPCDPRTGELDADPDLQHDRRDPCHPRTVFGYLVEALRWRRRTGRGGLTVLSCDNRPDSAAAARASVLALADDRDPALAGWIARNVSFPDSMVDRITPATGDEHRRLVLEATGIVDRWPVVTEPFSQWVVEDAFAAARPPLDEVGVQYVHDVGPWKQVKTRLLNGSHCALGYLGLLAGHADTAAAMADPVIKDYLAALMSREVGPLLPDLPGLDQPGYQQTLLDRFANPALVDPLTRLAGRASTKLPAYLMPSLTDAVQQNRPHELLTLAVAAWIRCLQGAAAVDGRPVELADARADELRTLARRGGTDPSPLLATGLFGPLAEHPGFPNTLGRLLHHLSEHGPDQTLAASLRR